VPAAVTLRKFLLILVQHIAKEVESPFLCNSCSLFPPPHVWSQREKEVAARAPPFISRSSNFFSQVSHPPPPV